VEQLSSSHLSLFTVASHSFSPFACCPQSGTFLVQFLKKGNPPRYDCDHGWLLRETRLDILNEKGDAKVHQEKYTLENSKENSESSE
jgi:hypothetical protein